MSIHIPILSRRQALTLVTAIAAASAVAVPAIPSAMTANRDAELIALGARLDALLPRIAAAKEIAHANSISVHDETARRCGFDVDRDLSPDEGKLWFETFCSVTRERGLWKSWHPPLDELDEQADAIMLRMRELPIRTLQGAAVMARSIALWGASSELSGPEDDLEWGAMLLRELIDRLCVAAGIGLPFSDDES
jgi:hypothetical protein